MDSKSFQGSFGPQGIELKPSTLGSKLLMWSRIFHTVACRVCLCLLWGGVYVYIYKYMYVYTYMCMYINLVCSTM